MNFKCYHCGCKEYHEDFVNKVYEIDKELFMVKNIPAFICDNCGEKYFTSPTHDRVMNLIHGNIPSDEIIETKVLQFA